MFTSDHEKLRQQPLHPDARVSVLLQGAVMPSAGCLVLDNLTLKCNETFAVAVICFKGACVCRKVVISHWGPFQNRGILKNFADLAVQSRDGQSAFRSEIVAKWSKLSGTKY
jgi:hypothetical protein